MHKKHADKGLVVIMVCVDDPEEKDIIESAEKILRDKKPPFVKLRLDESSDLWSKKLDFNSPPCYFVFDRTGKWIRFRGSDYTDGVPYAAMETAIVKMLQQK